MSCNILNLFLPDPTLGEAFVQHTFFSLLDEDNSIGGGYSEDPDEAYDPHKPYQNRPLDHDKFTTNLYKPIGGGGLDHPITPKPFTTFQIDRPNHGSDGSIIIFSEVDEHKPLTRPKPQDNYHTIFDDPPSFTFEDPDHSIFTTTKRPYFHKRPTKPGRPSFSKPSRPQKPITKPLTFHTEEDDDADFVFGNDSGSYSRPNKRRPGFSSTSSHQPHRFPSSRPSYQQERGKYCELRE